MCKYVWNSIECRDRGKEGKVVSFSLYSVALTTHGFYGCTCQAIWQYHNKNDNVVQPYIPQPDVVSKTDYSTYRFIPLHSRLSFGLVSAGHSFKHLSLSFGS